jgi:hypothetical protein
LIACIFAAENVADANRTSEVFTSRHRLSAELLPLAQEILGEQAAQSSTPDATRLS